jgi:hypothetical protein
MIWKYDPWMYGEDKPLNKEFPLDEIIKKKPRSHDIQMYVHCF